MTIADRLTERESHGRHWQRLYSNTDVKFSGMAVEHSIKMIRVHADFRVGEQLCGRHQTRISLTDLSAHLRKTELDPN